MHRKFIGINDVPGFAMAAMEVPRFLFQCRLLRPVLLGVLIILLTLAHCFAETSNNTQLQFLGNKNIAPVVYLDNAAPAGIAVDIVHALAKHMPQPIEIKAMDWSKAQELVARGDADALIQINQTEERKKIYDFSDTLLESQFSIFTTTNRVGISGISSLDGLRVGVESGGLPRQVLERHPDILLTIIPDFLKGFKLLSDGAIDAVVVDYRVGSYVIAENKLRNIKVTGEPIAYSYSSFAVKKGNIKLLGEINNALQIIKADGTYQKVIDKWKPKEVVFQTREQIAQQIFYVVIVILLLMAAIWMLALKRELTKRKAAEESLRERYSTLRGIINSANALIFSVDRRYRYTSFNQGHAAAMKALYGVEIEQGRSVLDYMTVPEDRESAKRNLDRALAGEQLVEEAYSGEELRSRQYFQVSHSPIKAEEQIIGVAVLAQDITERKRVEENLRRMNERYALSTRAARLGVWDWNIQKNELVWDDRMYELYGVKREDFAGAYEAWLQGVHPDDRAASDEISKQARRGEREYDTEFRVVWPDGSVHHLKAYGEFVRYADGKPLRMTGVNYDITELKRAEEKLRLLNESLEQRVREETARNMAQERMLIQQSRLAAMGEMIHNIAHQWRQPINALTLLLGNIKDAYEYNELTGEYLDSEVKTGQRLIQGMSTTIDDFRNFFMPNKEKERFLAWDAVEEAIKLVLDSFAAHNIRIIQEKGGENCGVMGYPNEFAQVVLNVLTNAKEAIVGKKIAGEIGIMIIDDEGAVMVSIRDM